MSQRKIFLEQVRQSGASLNDVITWDGAGWVASPVDLGNPTFYSLTDAANYTVGDAHRVLKINSDGTGVEFGLVLGSAASQDASYFALSGSVTASTLTQTSGTILGRSSAGNGAIEELTLGAGLSLVDGVLSSTGGGSASYPDFVGNTGKVLAVNSTEDGVEWVDQVPGSAGSGTNWSNSVTAVGTGAPQDITLPESGLSESDVLVFINGIRYETDEYVIDGSTLSITSNSAGDSIEIIKSTGVASGNTPVEIYAVTGASVSGVSTSAFAAKGQLLLPSEPVTLVGVNFTADVVAGETYYIGIYRLAGLQIAEVVAETNPVTIAATATGSTVSFDLEHAVNLDTGNRYGVLAVRTDDTATAVSSIYYSDGTFTTDGLPLGVTQYLRIANNNPAIGNTLETGTDSYHIGVWGYATDRSHTSSTIGQTHVVLSQAEYDSLSPPDPNTFYFITSS